MADNLSSYQTILNLFNTVAEGGDVGVDFRYGVPSEINNVKNNTYPIMTCYPSNTTIKSNDLLNERYTAQTTFRFYLFYSYPLANSDNNDGSLLISNHSQAQDRAYDFIRFLNKEMEDNNNIYMFNPSDIDIQFFEEMGTDRICGVTFTMTINYFEDCKA